MLSHSQVRGIACAGIVWDTEAVYRYFSGPPNTWTRAKTFRNVLRKLDPREVDGDNWDKDSIMHYPFVSGLIAQPVQYRRRGLYPSGGENTIPLIVLQQELSILMAHMVHRRGGQLTGQNQFNKYTLYRDLM